MKKLLCSLSALLLLAAAYTPLAAQIETPAPSPAAEVEQMVGLTEVEISYSSPGVKGRTIFAENGLVPFGKPWRLGANAATQFSFDRDVVLAGVEMEAGAYAVLATPFEDKPWKFSFYPYESGSWNSYLDKEPAAEVMTKPRFLESEVERMRFTIENTTMEGADIVLAWDNTMVKLPLEVHTEKQVQASIDEVMSGPSSDDYYAAASYYHEMGKDLEQALEWIEKATDVENPRFWQVRRKALILADLGKKDKAIKAAKQSMELAEAAGNEAYVKMNKQSIQDWSKK